MAEESWCARCDLPLFLCAHPSRYARYAGFAEPADLDAWSEEASSQEAGPVREARYDGRCRGCGTMIMTGDPVRFGNLEDKRLCLQCAGED
jgi:hypothetical protein